MTLERALELMYPVRVKELFTHYSYPTGATMFAIHCPRHGQRVLLGLSDIDEIENSASGVAVHYTCSCGHHGTWLTGKQTTAA